MIEVNDVWYRYAPKAPPILSGLNETFKEGEMAALSGPSGRGKSTLLYLLGLMLRPSRGEIVVGGVATSKLRDSGRASLRSHQFGFVFQDAVLDPARSVIDNVLEGSIYRGSSRTPARTEALQLLEQFGVSFRGKAKPSQVSGGQAQRIALCRALLSSPSVILADEPTGNLDQHTAATVISALKQYAASGKTVIVATHDPMVLAACTRVVTL